MGNPDIEIVKASYRDECSCHIYEIIIKDRKGLLAKLAKHEVFGGVHYCDNTEYAVYAYDHGRCSHAHECFQHIRMLPLHMWLTDVDVEQIITIVNDFIK